MRVPPSTRNPSTLTIGTSTTAAVASVVRPVSIPVLMTRRISPVLPSITKDMGNGTRVEPRNNAREDLAHKGGHLEDPGGNRAADADGNEEHDGGAEVVVSWWGQQASREGQRLAELPHYITLVK